MYSDLLDSQFYHNDDLIEVGHPSEPWGDKPWKKVVETGDLRSNESKSVRYVRVNYESAAQRNIADIQKNITRRKLAELGAA